MTFRNLGAYGTLIRPLGYGFARTLGVRPTPRKYSRTVGRIKMFKKLIEDAAARAHPYKSTEEIAAEVLAKRDDIGHEIARRFTRGNVNIKLGNFLTKDDLDARRKR